MALDLVDYERKDRDAVLAFWGNLDAARKKQVEIGKTDQVERADVASGDSVDGLPPDS